MRIFLLFALVGATFALQYPIEYQYRYDGRIATGIPGIAPQVAAIGIRAKLIVQMRSASQALVQIRDVLTGKINHKVESTFLRQVLPITYKPLPSDMQRQMELPFAVNFLEEKDRVMDVSDKDKLWMTNIRKSIVEVLLLEPIRYNKDTLPVDPVYKKIGHIRAPASFSIEEETIFGKCESQYTITQLPRSSAMNIEKMLQDQIEVDVQSRRPFNSVKSSIPKIDEKLWKLVRSINFDSCHERVILQHASVSNTSKAGYGQFDSLQSRSSVGTYILRGSTGAFRVEKATVEGTVLRRPLGMKTENLHSITNQTLKLEKAMEIQTSLSLPSTRPVKTWRYEVLSPYSPPFGTSKLWVDYTAKGTKFTPISMYYILLGLRPNAQRLMVSLEEELQKAADELLEVPRPPADMPSLERNHVTLPASRMQTVSSILEVLPIETIEEIFQHFFNKKGKKAELEQVLLVDAAAAAGTSAPMKVLLDYIESHKVSSARAASLFVTLTNQISSPAIIPELMEYVKTIDVEERPYLASAALINFAKLANRMCLTHEARNYSAFNVVYGSETCKPSIILDEYLPYLEQLLRRLPKSHEKAIIVQAIAELGTPEALPVLVKVAHGEFGKSSRPRSIALYAMSANKMHKKAKREIYDILLEIIEQVGETPEVRQAAIVSLMSHNPPPTFYQRLARLTWRDVSPQTAAFIYLTLDSMSKSTGAGSLQHAARARFALPLAKPFSPSMVYSYNFMQASFMQSEDILTEYALSSIVNMKSYLPKELYVLLQNNFAGFKISPIQIGLFAEGINTRLPHILEALHKMRLEETYGHNHHSKHPKSRMFRREEILQEMRRLNLELPIATDPEFAVFVRMLDNMVSYLPFNNDIMKKYAGHGASDLIHQLRQGITYNLTKFVDPMEYTFFVPTEIGLPLISMTKMPTIQYMHGHVKLNMSGESQKYRSTYSEVEQEKKMELLIKSKYKLISRLDSKFVIYAPWDESQIEAGVDTAKVMNLPLYVNISVSNNFMKKGVKINLSSISKHAFAPLYAHNIPYTAYKPIMPVPHAGQSSVKIVTIEGNKSPLMTRRSPSDKKVSGIDSLVQFAGDVPYPYTSGNVMDYLRYPQQFSKLLSSPTAKLWQTAYIVNPMNSPTQNISISLSYMTGYMRLHEPVMSKKFVELEPKHIAKRLMSVPSSNSDMSYILLEAGVLLNGTQVRKFNSALALQSAIIKSSKNAESYKKYEAQLHLYAHPVVGYHSKPREMVVKAEFTTPNITTLLGLKEKVQSNIMKDKFRVQVIMHPDYENPIMDLEGKIVVSEERKRLVLEELRDVCQYDKKTPTSMFQVPAVYDKAEAVIKYKLHQIPRTLLNYTYIGEEMMKGMYYPHVYVNKMGVENAPDQISVYMKRPVYSHHYKFEIEKPKERIVLDKVNLKGLLSMVPYYGLKMSCNKVDSAILPDIPLSTCKINKREIVPFNKVSYPFIPLKCWTKVAFDPRRTEEFVIEVRQNHNSEMEVKASSTAHGVAIKISDSEILVNGKKVVLEGPNRYTVEDAGKKPIAFLFLVPDEHIYAVINQRYVIRLRYDDLHIFDLKPHGSLVGACGTTNAYEMVGPQGCIYRPENALLLKYAYTKPEGHKCDIEDYETHRERVSQFQKYCTKKTHYLSGKSALYAEKPKDCYHYVYPIITDEKRSVCVTERSIQRCREECFPEETRHVPVKMKCWSPAQSPRQVLVNEPRGYTKHPVTERETYEIGYNVRQNIKCKPNYSS